MTIDKTKNKNLQSAKTNKKDEFYTQLVDIENELKHYKKHFLNKIVLCNCDTEESNFYIYFKNNYNELGLKGLLRNGNIKGIGDGDFRSEECIELLKQADIVVTNPPFSLFREYVAQLIEHKKKFVIIGHQNAITHKECFKLIKENKMWLGFGFTGGAAHFINNNYVDYATAGNHKTGMIRVSGVVWFTNLDYEKHHEDLILTKTYNKKEFPTYDNYDAINVDKTKDIPMDYKGVMGVPITFMDKYNPEQFEIIGIDRVLVEEITGKVSRFRLKGKEIYARIIIKNKKLNEYIKK